MSVDPSSNPPAASSQEPIARDDPTRRKLRRRRIALVLGTLFAAGMLCSLGSGILFSAVNWSQLIPDAWFGGTGNELGGLFSELMQHPNVRKLNVTFSYQGIPDDSPDALNISVVTRHRCEGSDCEALADEIADLVFSDYPALADRVPVLFVTVTNQTNVGIVNFSSSHSYRYPTD